MPHWFYGCFCAFLLTKWSILGFYGFYFTSPYRNALIWWALKRYPISLLKVEWAIMSAHFFSLITVISFNNKTISSHHSSIINDLRETTLIETKGPTRLNGNFAATWAAELQLLVQRNWQFSKDFLWWRMLLIKVAIDQSSWYSLDFLPQWWSASNFHQYQFGSP